MNSLQKDINIKIPELFIIRYKNIYTTLAIKINSEYIFNKNKSLWISIKSDLIDSYIDKISDDDIKSIKKELQSSTKNSIRLLVIYKKIFNKVPERFQSLEKYLDISNIDFSGIESIQYNYNTFNLLSINDLKNLQSIKRPLWRLIYINKLLKSYDIPEFIKDWDILLTPLHYLFDSNKFGLSNKLIQLHKAINQIKNNDDINIENIKELGYLLDKSIYDFDFNLPDICIKFDLSYNENNIKSLNNKDLIKKSLLLIYKLSKLGIVNNYSEISNLYLNTNNNLGFKSYNDSILYSFHDLSFDKNSFKKVLNVVYNKNDELTNDNVFVFNCLVMYDVIRLMISIKKIMNTSEDHKLINNIISDANGIMKQVFSKKPDFDCNNDLSKSIEWLYKKNILNNSSNDLNNNKIIVFKDYDNIKFNYLKDYYYGLDFSKSI